MNFLKKELSAIVDRTGRVPSVAIVVQKMESYGKGC